MRRGKKTRRPVYQRFCNIALYRSVLISLCIKHSAAFTMKIPASQPCNLDCNCVEFRVELLHVTPLLPTLLGSFDRTLLVSEGCADHWADGDVQSVIGSVL